MFKGNKMIKHKDNDLNPKTSDSNVNNDRLSERAGREARAKSRGEPVHKNWKFDRRLDELISRLYWDAKCGRAAAEYNLEKAGLIEMISGHVAGQMRDGDNSGMTFDGRSPSAANAPAWLIWSASSCGIHRLRSHCGTPRRRPLTSPTTVVASPAIRSW